MGLGRKVEVDVCGVARKLAGTWGRCIQDNVRAVVLVKVPCPPNFYIIRVHHGVGLPENLLAAACFVLQRKAVVYAGAFAVLFQVAACNGIRGGVKLKIQALAIF